MGFFVECSKCRATYARILLRDAEPRCRCGKPLALEGVAPRFVDRDCLQEEEARIYELSRLADQVSFLIVATDCPRIDIDIKRAEVRRRCEEFFPEKMHLFEMIYASRFERLWEQFRNV